MNSIIYYKSKLKNYCKGIGKIIQQVINKIHSIIIHMDSKDVMNVKLF